MDIYSANWSDPPGLLWYKTAAQWYAQGVAAGMTGEPAPFPTDTITVLLRKSVNYTAFLAT